MATTTTDQHRQGGQVARKRSGPGDDEMVRMQTASSGNILQRGDLNLHQLSHQVQMLFDPVLLTMIVLVIFKQPCIDSLLRMLGQHNPIRST